MKYYDFLETFTLIFFICVALIIYNLQLSTNNCMCISTTKSRNIQTLLNCKATIAQNERSRIPSNHNLKHFYLMYCFG